MVKITGADQTLAALNNAAKQTSYALSQTINDCLVSVQEKTVDQILPRTFTLRFRGSPWWRPKTKFGFNIKFAQKANPTGTIGSQADWLRLHEEGGTKTASGGKTLAIPTSTIKPGREVMQRSRKPRVVLRRKTMFGSKAFTVKGGIYVRQSKKRYPLVKLFQFTPLAHIAADLEWEKQARAIVEKEWPGRFESWFAKAMSTAR